MIDIGIIACFELNLTNCQEEPLLFWNRDLSCLTVSVRELRKCVLSRSLKTTWPVELYEGPFLGLTKAKWSRLILFSHCISLLHIKEEWKWMKLCAVFKSHLDLLCVRWLKHIYSRIYTCCSPGGRLQTFFLCPQQRVSAARTKRVLITKKQTCHPEGEVPDRWRCITFPYGTTHFHRLRKEMSEGKLRTRATSSWCTTSCGPELLDEVFTFSCNYV
jgi:hypothetical protein